MKALRKVSHLGGVLLAFLAVAAGPALADDDTRSTPRKDGFLVGFGAGLGETFPCEECLSFAGHFTIGGMARERIAVVADFAVVGGYDAGGETGSLLVGAPAVQFWPHQRIWLRVGLGVGTIYNAHWLPPITPFVVAVVAAGGFELVQDGAFTVDAQVRCAFLVRSAFIERHQSVALGIGLNWY